MEGVRGVGMCMLCGVWCACAHGCVYGMHCAYSHRWCAVCGLWCVVSMACSCVCVWCVRYIGLSVNVHAHQRGSWKS
jgi:hypothetical protein